ncbi:MAG: SusD/RagB family nutrient-binding outer membrane lipoprotein [Gillisia sp.]
MKKIKILLFLTLGILTFNSCETIELDNLENPNALNPTQASVDLYMNAIQIRLATSVNQLSGPSSDLTRVTNLFGRNYPNAFGPASFDAAWTNSYGNIKDIREMNILAEELNLDKHIGVGQVIEAYIMMNLVDTFGDVPYSEAFDVVNLNPNPDSGAEIYTAVRTLLDEAIVNLGSEDGLDLDNDFYYENDFDNWIKLANTLKMKTYIQTRLVDAGAITAFEQIVAGDNYIKTNAESFAFNWGNNLDNPNSRHPLYNGAYAPGGTTGYRSNWLMNLMRNDKSVQDPRIRFYFYRQVNDVMANVDEESGAELRCTQEPIPNHYEIINAVYCVIPNDGGYWGRDHGDNSGLPPDSFLQTAWGLYPAGGRFDDSSFEGIDGNNYGAEGNGITPMILAPMVDLWRAEAALFGGTGDAAVHLESGVSKHIAYVKSFISRDSEADTGLVPGDDATVAYIAEVIGELTAASESKKLDVIGEQLFIVAYGNGIDAYNFYRRTGSPGDIQPNIEPNPGAFVRSFWYPANEVSANANLNQKPNVGVRVFWDNNPETGFIN